MRYVRWIAVATAIVAAVVIAGWAMFGRDWWPNAVAELAGVIAGGFVIALLIEWRVQAELNAEADRRWQRVWPFVEGRLKSDLEVLYTLCSPVTVFGGTADLYNPISERLSRLREMLFEEGRADEVEVVELIQSVYPPLSAHLREMSTRLIPFALEHASEDALVAELVALEEAGREMRILYLYSGRAAGANQWPALRERIADIIDKALPLAERVKGSYDWA